MSEEVQGTAEVNPATALEGFGFAAFRTTMVICLLPSFVTLLILLWVFAADGPALQKVLLLQLPMVVAFGTLLVPVRILMLRRATRVLTLVAAALAAHQSYSSFSTFAVLQAFRGPVLFFGIACAFVAGAVSLALYLRRNSRWKPVPFVAGALLVSIALVFGSGNPQWSRFIFVWQVHYSPYGMDAGNLPTNRSDPRSTLPRYTEWDSLGRKTLEWTHPDGALLRTEFFPDGQKRREILSTDRDVVTEYYRYGRMAHQRDWKTGTQRWWYPDGTLYKEVVDPAAVK